MERIKKYAPESALFANQEELVLMSKSSRDEYGGLDRENEVASVTIWAMDSGAF